MASVDSWLSPGVMHALGWTLIHSLWQCLGVAALAATLMALSRRPSTRYVVAVGALVAMLAVPVATLFALMKSAPPVHAVLPASSGFPAYSSAFVSGVPATANTSPVAAPSTATSNSKISAFENFPRSLPSPSDFPPNLLLWLVGAWFFGVALFSLRFAGGFLLLEHRRRRQSITPSPRILAMCHELQLQLGLNRAIRYLECGWLQAPAVIGWIRPVILLPVAALTGLSEEQLQAVIAHELAHIRRLDSYVNLFQILVETLLFYHPAMWWLNRRIRAERELCCDEMAVSLTGNRLEYARALTLMVEWKNAPILAMAANRGPLSQRILHILGRKPFGAGQRMMGLTGGVLFLAAALAAANALFGIAYPIPMAHANESLRTALSSGRVAVDHAVRQALQASEPAAKNAAPDQPGGSGTRGPETTSVVADQIESVENGQLDRLVPPSPETSPAPKDASAPVMAANDLPTAPAQPATNPAPSEAAESVTVTATKLPGRSAVDEFIYSYPAPVRTTDKIARWKRGICPMVEGLPPRYAAFITGRLIAIAQKAGAPVNADSKCRHNIEIVFTNTPQALADVIHKEHRPYLGYFDNLHQADELAKVKHDIQAWYLTATVGSNGMLRVDNPRQDFLTGNNGLGENGVGGGGVFYAGSGGRGSNGASSTLYNIIIVANPAKLGDYEMGSLADYIAMLALSQPKSFDACWEVPSITNLLSSTCDAARKTPTLSDNDAAFLYGLYKMGTADSVFMQRSEIRYFIERNPARK
jgi:beta-lactamase regulating signal transducer with metallopeptidase domain